MESILQNKKVLVTGAAGLMGANMLLRLKEMPDVQVKALYHKHKPQVMGANISFEQVDLTRMEDCRRVVEDVDYVFMFAAHIARRSQDLTHAINTVQMNLNMLEASHQSNVKKFIWLSSATAYPYSDSPLKEEDMFADDPHEAHFALGWSTRYIEKMGKAYANNKSRKMPVIVLRPTAIYGPYGDFEFATSHVLPALIRRVVERQEPIEIWGTGETKRDFIYVDDVVDAVLLALELDFDFDVFNVASGNPCRVKDLLDLIIDVDHFTDAKVTFDTSKTVKSPVIAVDCQKAKDVLKFTAKTSLEQGIEATIDWYKKNTVLV